MPEAESRDVLARILIANDGEVLSRLRLSAAHPSIGRLETLEEVEEAIERVSVQDCRDLLDRLPLPEHEVGVALGPVPELAVSD